MQPTELLILKTLVIADIKSISRCDVRLLFRVPLAKRSDEYCISNFAGPYIPLQ